jgi:hypothetical protein
VRIAAQSLRGAGIAFWIVFALALGVGGETALMGLPNLGGALMPGGFEAEAHSWPITDFVALTFAGPLRSTPQAGISDGTTWATRPRAPTPARALPAIAIVIDDMGSDVASNRRAIALPAAVALSFLPYPEATPLLAGEGARAGHDILVHLPMQAESREEDPGPMALRTDLPLPEINRRIDWAFSRVPGFIGINNHMGSLYTQDRAALVPVAEAVADRHVFFLDSRTTQNSQIVPVARAFGAASASRDVFLDDVQDPRQVADQLAELERYARASGVAIAIGHPHSVTLDVLGPWCANLKDYRLVTIATAIRMKTEREVNMSLASLGR